MLAELCSSVGLFWDMLYNDAGMCVCKYVRMANLSSVYSFTAPVAQIAKRAMARKFYQEHWAGNNSLHEA
jgi:hypothetical protein